MLGTWVDYDARWADGESAWQPTGTVLAAGVGTAAATAQAGLVEASAVVASGMVGTFLTPLATMAVVSALPGPESAQAPWSVGTTTARPTCSVAVGMAAGTFSSEPASIATYRTTTLSPAAATDTGYSNNHNEYFSTGYSSNYCEIGKYGTNQDRSWIRLALTDIPAGAVIESAQLSLTAYDTKSTATCSVLVGAVDADNPSAPASYSAALALSVMNGALSWTPGTWTDGTIVSVDITPVIQTVVDRTNYHTGDHVLLLLSDNGSSTDAYRRFSTYSFDSGSEKPSLVLVYQTASSTGPSVATAIASWEGILCACSATVVAAPETTEGTWAVHVAHGTPLADVAGGNAPLATTANAAVITIEDTADVSVPVNVADLSWASKTAFGAANAARMLGTAGGTWSLPAAQVPGMIAAQAEPVSARLSGQPTRPTADVHVDVQAAAGILSTRTVTVSLGNTTTVAGGAAAALWDLHAISTLVRCAITQAPADVSATTPKASGQPRILAAVDRLELLFTTQSTGTRREGMAHVLTAVAHQTVGDGLAVPRVDRDATHQGLACMLQPATVRLATGVDAGAVRACVAVTAVTATQGQYAIWRYGSPLSSRTRLSTPLPKQVRFATHVTIKQT